MRKDSYYEDDEDLARQREIIEKRLKSMNYDDDYVKPQRHSSSSKSSSSQRSSSSSRSSSGGRKAASSSSGSKVQRISADEIEYAEKKGKSSYNKKPQQKKKKKKRRGRKIIRNLVIIAVLIIALITGAIYYMLSGLTRAELGEVDASDGVSYIKNIALFGIDTRDSESTSGRSDAIMIMSVNKKTGEINLISVLRDSYVSIEGYSDTKINAAYSYGGATLAVKTLNQNFSMDITDYITVNFAQLATIIDAAGGVTLEITAEEAEQINKNLDDAADEGMTTQEVEYVTVADQTVLLNGDQAVAYSRIRKIDSDNVRASRQQKVLSAVLNNIKEMPVWKYPVFIRKFLSVSESSLSNAEILSFAPLIFKSFTINSYTIPDIDYETDLTSGYSSSGQWCWFYDLDGAAARIHSIIYEE